MNTPTPAGCSECRRVLPASVCALHYDTYLLRWRTLRFSFDEYLAWVETTPYAENAATYRAVGLIPGQARPWVTTRLPATTAVQWHEAGLSPDDAVAWLRVRTVTTVADQRRLAAEGHTPASAEEAYGTKAGFRWPVTSGARRRGGEPT